MKTHGFLFGKSGVWSKPSCLRSFKRYRMPLSQLGSIGALLHVASKRLKTQNQESPTTSLVFLAFTYSYLQLSIITYNLPPLCVEGKTNTVQFLNGDNLPLDGAVMPLVEQSRCSSSGVDMANHHMNIAYPCISPNKIIYKSNINLI